MSQPQTYAARSVAEAIEAACADLGCEREQLDIEILSPGMIGLFGICFKKAKIRVRRKNDAAITVPPAPREGAADDHGTGKEEESPAGACHRLLAGMLAAMDLPLSVEVTAVDAQTLIARIEGEDPDLVIGDNGEGLDALQYLVRKMLSKQFHRKIAVTVDAGSYRERRQEELESLARRLAGEVKSAGRNRATGPLNPAERRIVHMALQDDPAVRSRSVGDGLYKKVLITPSLRPRRPGRRPRGQRTAV